MTSTGPDVSAAWLATIAPETQATLASRPSATIVPARREHSAQRAADMLSYLAERGRPIELRTGKVIGEGGMGLVREAEQVALGRTVAIKTLKPGRPEGAADLLREAWITGALEHPNIVPVHHLEIDEALSPLLVLKRVDGVEWSTLLRDATEVQRRFSTPDLLAWNLRILDQVLNALRFAHARGVVHRDLKPSNVMIGEFGEVYLLDWGIAVSMHDDAKGRFPLAREADQLAGTPCYMAPEMLRRDGDPPITERTDVYLAGAVLFELIAGVPPHQGTSALAIMSSIIMSRPQLPGDAPAELAAICTRAMRSDPAERFASIEELQKALADYLEHRGSARLMTHAVTQLAELSDLAGKQQVPDREDIYRRLAIVKFGFHEALAAWRENSEAQDGLSRAAIAVAEYELACGDPSAAVTLLSDLPSRSSGLALLARAETAAARKAELARMGRDLDPTVHGYTRRIALIIGAAFTLTPIIGALAPSLQVTTYPRQLAWAVIMFVVSSLIALVSRRRVLTPINRHIFAGIQFIFAAQIVSALGSWAAGVPETSAQSLNIFLWGVVFGGFAMAVDRFLLIVSATYFVAFLVAMRFPDARYWAMSASNFAMAVSLGYRWRDLQTEPKA